MARAVVSGGSPPCVLKGVFSAPSCRLSVAHRCRSPLGLQRGLKSRLLVQREWTLTSGRVVSLRLSFRNIFFLSLLGPERCSLKLVSPKVATGLFNDAGAEGHTVWPLRNVERRKLSVMAHDPSGRLQALPSSHRGHCLSVFFLNLSQPPSPFPSSPPASSTFLSVLPAPL